MTAGGLFVCRARASPGKSAETILSRKSMIKTVRGLGPHARNICANLLLGLVQIFLGSETIPQKGRNCRVVIYLSRWCVKNHNAMFVS